MYTRWYNELRLGQIPNMSTGDELDTQSDAGSDYDVPASHVL
jgi:hypothetical protein